MFQGCFWWRMKIGIVSKAGSRLFDSACTGAHDENRDSQQGWFPSFDFQRAKIQEICEKKEDL